jgi:hypothetical protein
MAGKQSWTWALWPLGGTIFGILVIPLAIAQYPKFFNENEWLLPTSLVAALACWIVPLMLHDRARRIYSRVTSVPKFGLGIFGFLLLTVIAVIAVGGRGLFRVHSKHLRESIAASQTPNPLTHEPTQQQAKVPPPRVPFDCHAEGIDLKQQYLDDPKNKKEEFVPWLNRQIRERELPCNIPHIGKQQVSKRKNANTKPVAAPVPDLPVLVDVHGGKNIDVSHIEGGKVNMDGVENGTISHVGDKTAVMPTPTPAPSPPQ